MRNVVQVLQFLFCNIYVFISIYMIIKDNNGEEVPLSKGWINFFKVLFYSQGVWNLLIRFAEKQFSQLFLYDLKLIWAKCLCRETDEVDEEEQTQELEKQWTTIDAFSTSHITGNSVVAQCSISASTSN